MPIALVDSIMIGCGMCRRFPWLSARSSMRTSSQPRVVGLSASGAVEIALQVSTYSVVAAKGALELEQRLFRLVPLVRQPVHGGLALWWRRGTLCSRAQICEFDLLSGSSGNQCEFARAHFEDLIEGGAVSGRGQCAGGPSGLAGPARVVQASRG